MTRRKTQILFSSTLVVLLSALPVLAETSQQLDLTLGEIVLQPQNQSNPRYLARGSVRDGDSGYNSVDSKLVSSYVDESRRISGCDYSILYEADGRVELLPLQNGVFRDHSKMTLPEELHFYDAASKTAIRLDLMEGFGGFTASMSASTYCLDEDVSHCTKGPAKVILKASCTQVPALDPEKEVEALTLWKTLLIGRTVKYELHEKSFVGQGYDGEVFPDDPEFNSEALKELNEKLLNPDDSCEFRVKYHAWNANVTLAARTPLKTQSNLSYKGGAFSSRASYIPGKYKFTAIPEKDGYRGSQLNFLGYGSKRELFNFLFIFQKGYGDTEFQLRQVDVSNYCAQLSSRTEGTPCADRFYYYALEYKCQ